VNPLAALLSGVMFPTSSIMDFALLQDTVWLVLMVPADTLKAVQKINSALSATIFFIPILLLKVFGRRFIVKKLSYFIYLSKSSY
jgi:hypothetical protein